jgi:NAD+ synthase (glutamine-hydrolysing)
MVSNGSLRVGLAQLKPRKARVEENLERLRQWTEDYASRVDLLVFPEAALSGYFLEGGVAEAARSAQQVATGLGSGVSGFPDVVIGFYERHRRRLFNSVGYFTPGEDGYSAVHIHRKIFLPTYGVFDEARFVEPGRTLEAFDTRFGRMGMLVCEEMWHSLTPTILALDGAETIIAVSASPARDFSADRSGLPKNLQRWQALAPAAAEEHGVFVVVSQLVGSEGGKMFPGGSLVAAPSGEIVGRAPLLDEGVTTVSLEADAIDRARVQSPLLSDLEQSLPHLRRSLDSAVADAEERKSPDDLPEEKGPQETGGPLPANALPEATSMLDLDLELVEKVLIEFIREEVVRRRGFAGVVIGLSGGVDSSVAAYLAASALGPENVYGFRLPYATSSGDSLAHARLVSEATGIHERTLEITPMVDGYIGAHEPDLTPLRRGNLCARSRAVTLFDQSAKLHALPLGTGNKSERLLGYYTWHADDSPPINPLGDLLKCQVWDLARHLGVPHVIVDKPASADLVEDVHDEDELGISYAKADPILHWLLGGFTPADLMERGFPEADVDLVWRRLNATHWKRELPTVAMVSSSAIGEFYLRPVDF